MRMDVDRLIERPILILGSPRSGTTMLGNLIAKHPDVAYWEEPRTIWSQGKNAWNENDRLVADDLTPALARRIDERFHRFLVASERSRFAEKTPSNTLRLPFIRGLYPDARIIHVVRDGRAVVASMMEMLNTPPGRDRMIARLRETPLRDLPALVPLYLRDVWRRDRKPYWGPRPPSWRDWLDLPVPAMLARQWQHLVTTARSDLRREFSADQWMELRYEDFIADPTAGMEKMLTVTDLGPAADFSSSFTSDIRVDRIDHWKNVLSAEAIQQIETEAGDLLTELGYSRITPETIL